MTDLKKRMLLAWHEKHPNDEKIGIVHAQKFVRLFNPAVDVFADFNNEKTPFHIEPIGIERKTVFYKDEIFKMCEAQND